MSRLSIFIILAITLITGGVIIRNNGNVPKQIAGGNQTIELREDGFYPQEITVKTGSKITFKTTQSEDFWPAGDPHPTHEFLNGFDPGSALKSDEEWFFVFEKPGVWRYHDHLNVSNRGTITVVSGGNDGEIYNPNDEQQFDEKVRTALKDGGIEAAFAVFTELFQNNRAPESCHWTSHLIGEEVYERFKNGEDFPVTNAVSYCGYGFFHGFMEKMLHENPDPQKAIEFCDQIGEKMNPQARDNCIHGIGHGFTEEEPPPKEKWGDPEALLHPGLDVCEFLFGKTERKWEICSTGVYTVIGSWMKDNEYDLSLDTDDVFALCRTQPERYWTACFGEFAPFLDSITGWNPAKLESHIKGITDERLKKYVVHVSSGVMMQKDIAKNDWTDYIQNCRLLPDDLPYSCIGGVAWGLVIHGPPGKEYEKAFQFCETDILDGEEQNSCYREAVAQLKRSYEGREKEKNEACEIINPTYKQMLCYN